MKAMDGLGIPILGGLIGFVALMVCTSDPRFRRFALAAIISPLAASLVFVIGSFLLADMNLAREYGAQYTPTGKEHDPTTFDTCLWLGSTVVTFFLSAFVCVWAQRIWAGITKRLRPAPATR